MSNGDQHTTVGAPNEKAKAEISDWVKDMASLEAHIEEALDHQLKLEPSNPEVKQAIQRYHDTVRDSKHRSEEYVKTLGGPPTKGLVERGAELLGTAAGIIDKLRHDTASKAIRDDYTAFNHAAIGFTMLYTTAVAANDEDTASFAERGLRTYAGLVQDINNVIGTAVIEDLKANTGMPVENATVADKVRSTVDSVWKSTAS